MGELIVLTLFASVIGTIGLAAVLVLVREIWKTGVLLYKSNKQSFIHNPQE